MRGYLTPFGFMGYIDGRYRLFATENEYREILKERNGYL